MKGWTVWPLFRSDSPGMLQDVNGAHGTYRNGVVVPEGPVDWPEGSRVQMSRADEGKDYCVDGSEWDDSPEAIEKWKAWFDSLGPVFGGEELGNFEEFLRSARAEQNRLREG